MKELGKPSGLVRRKGSTSWYFRQRWPKRFERPGTPSNVWISLRTTCYREALEKMEWARGEAYRRFTEPAPFPVSSGIYSRSVRPIWPVDNGLPTLTSDQAPRLAQALFMDALRGIDAEPLLPADREDHAMREYRAELEERLLRLTGKEPEDEIDDVFGAKVAVLRKAGLRAETDSEACDLLHNYLRRAMAQATAIRLARLNGDYSDQITDRLFQPPLPNAVGGAPVPDVPSPTLTATTSLDPTLVDRWAKERKVSAKGVDKHRAVARWFCERVGTLPVEAITKKDVLAFKNKMVEEGVSAANANAKLSCLRTLLGYAVENALLEANPAVRVSVHDKDKDRRKRKEFDLAALHILFRSPVYAADARPPQGRGEAAYWLPVIALYTGARLEEIAQLRPTDIRQERYIDGDDLEQMTWVICISQEDGLSTKNANSERRVPVHPVLESLGFVQFVEEATNAGQQQLFPALKSNVYGKLGAKWGEWWSGYRREVCGITDRRMVFHSFRHTFKYHARHVGMIEGVQRQIMGHSPGDSADEYGASGYSLHQLVEGMKLYRVPGLVLPAAPPRFR